MPTAMPESIQKGPFFVNLDNALNNPTTREQVRADLQDWLKKQPLDNAAFAALAMKHKVFTDQVGGITAAAGRDHFLNDWLAPATFWWSVKNTAEILAQALLRAIDLTAKTGLPIGSLWSCHGTAEHVDVAVGVNGQQITFIIHTNQPPAQTAGTEPQNLFMVRNPRPPKMPGDPKEEGVQIVSITA
ncbi:MAG: hypothetical protein HYR72_12850 [Deltaproteobacteria bacterium]|nr:hypothetical protein [Deltaproteobacteria bacterium]MBI3390445.1 hypothetical protein [Deltaproteobacteria bacterium]